jgi:hypothetical protein
MEIIEVKRCYPSSKGGGVRYSTGITPLQRTRGFEYWPHNVPKKRKKFIGIVTLPSRILGSFSFQGRNKSIDERE